MLTRELAIAEYDFEKGRVLPDRLTRRSHARYLHYAEQLLNIYRQGTGRTRQELHRAVRDVFAHEEDCPVRRIEAFCKLLDDVSEFHRDSRQQAMALRREVFRMSAAMHPLVRCADQLFENTEANVKQQIAARLGRSWEAIDRDLFADVMDFHRLQEFAGYAAGAALLARYNVAQVQAALFDAVHMTVWAREDFKTILRSARLSGLMHSIRADRDEYCLRLDGPASLLRETRRYGAGMARFLPALIACRGWRLHAEVRTRRRGWNLSLDLSATDGLNSHLPAPRAFDSRVEENFAARWGVEPREGWRLVREGEILHQAQKVFVPDFVFRHADGRSVLMEIVGFWTPAYLEAKRQTLRRFRDHRILLAVPESTGRQSPELAADAILYKSSLLVKDVLERLKKEG